MEAADHLREAGAFKSNPLFAGGVNAVAKKIRKNSVTFGGLVRDEINNPPMLDSSSSHSNEARAAQLVLAHHGFVKARALRLAPLPGLADDITQQVFLEFLAKQQQWDLEADVKPLLATMTRHVAMRCWRERTRQLPEVVRDLAEHVRALAEVEAESAEARWEDELPALRRCVEKLPDQSRALVDLHYHGGLSTVEIAEQLAMKADAVRQAICRVRGQLRECIERALRPGGAHA